MRIVTIVALLLGLLNTANAKPMHPHPTTHAVDWTKIYTLTPAGGVKQGNPQAPVKLVEYFSPACPHCKHFVDDSRTGLSAMVATGKLSYETRPLLLGYPHEPALDVLLQCGTPAQDAALTDLFFAKQEEISAKIQPVFKANVPRWQQMPITAAYEDIADKLGLVALAQQAGISPARAHICLANKRNYDAIQAITKTAEQLHVSQTPSFFLNDAVLATVQTESSWVSVKRVLDATLPGVAWPPLQIPKKGAR